MRGIWPIRHDDAPSPAEARTWCWALPGVLGGAEGGFHPVAVAIGHRHATRAPGSVGRSWGCFCACLRKCRCVQSATAQKSRSLERKEPFGLFTLSPPPLLTNTFGHFFAKDRRSEFGAGARLSGSAPVLGASGGTRAAHERPTPDVTVEVGLRRWVFVVTLCGRLVSWELPFPHLQS